MNQQEQINHDKHHDESKTRNRFSKLPDDGDPRVPNNLLTPEQKKNTVGPRLAKQKTKIRPLQGAKSPKGLNKLYLLSYQEDIEFVFL